MRKLVLTFLVSLAGLVISTAQTSKNDEILFTIDKEPFYANEFVRVYNKNLSLVKDDSQKNLDTYLDLYVGYKLKVKKAKDLGLQNEDKYKRELASYRSQLAKNYTNDSKVTEELIQEAYDRMSEEVRASHILVMVDESALPKDTLAAYNKIVSIRNKVLAGNDFGTIAEQYSEDPSAKMNKGDLGYFTAFKMVYPFESAAYSTKVGDISGIFRTQFGYHFLKVTDKRKNRGEVEVKHIMITNAPGGDEVRKSRATIDELYQKLQQGENFEELAKQFSEDKTTAEKGGLLPRFSSGQLTAQEFEDQAFALNNSGDISKPFETKFGWHIVKLENKIPIKTLEEARSEIEGKIKRDSRSKIIENSNYKKLHNRYAVEINEKLFKKTEKIVTDLFYEQRWKKPEVFAEQTSTLVTLNNDTSYSADAFLKFVEEQQKSRDAKVKPIQNQVDVLLEKWINNLLVAYYDANLEKEYSDFHYIMDEYRDGLLLFDLMEREIWQKAKNDSVNIEKFYLDNSENYSWKRRLQTDIYSSTNKKTIEKAQKYLKKGKTPSEIKEKLNDKDRVNIMVKSGLYEENFDVLPQLNTDKEGVTDIVKKGDYYFVADVESILPASVKPLEECRGKVVSDYQQYLESNWVANLKKEYDVNVNQEVFEKVKKEISK